MHTCEPRPRKAKNPHKAGSGAQVGHPGHVLMDRRSDGVGGVEAGQLDQLHAALQGRQPGGVFRASADT